MLVNEQSISGKIYEKENLRGQLAEITNSVSGGLLDPSTLDSTAIHYDTTEAWNSQTFLIAERANFYIYTDAKIEEDEQGEAIKIAGLKIGDGTSYLIDMPFVFYGDDHEVLVKHISDALIHVSAVDRDRWDKNVNVKINPEDSEEIIFS